MAVKAIVPPDRSVVGSAAMRTWLGLAALATAALSACEDGGKNEVVPPPPPMTGRAAAVTAKATAAPAPSATVSAAPAAERKLCAGQKQRPAPKGSLKTAAAPDANAPPAALPIGVGKWTWINLWAAWCGPCKEEMPRLLAWQKKLTDAGVMLDLQFLSLDDDERQMRRFLESQPAGGVRSTYWLPEGDRGGWLGSINLKESPQLPVQILVAPTGQVACVIEGAVEDRDYPQLASFLGAKK
jgi:thiol-disulfide isomerase/thioredoxin